jgi:2-oxoglutarate ferredoxin oxidoreductase subunit alpha
MAKVDLSILIGGAAGDGTRQSGYLAARLFRGLGYYVFVHEDYPSLIRGGHNFSVIRISDKPVFCHKNRIDILIAMDASTIAVHKNQLNERHEVIFDSGDLPPSSGIGIEMRKIVKEKKYDEIMRNTIAVGALSYLLGAGAGDLEELIRKIYKKFIDENVELAGIGYEHAKNSGSVFVKLARIENTGSVLLTGSEAIGLGAVKAGLKNYIAYPMTPATPLLHFLAANQDKFNILVIHAENEIGVANMAIGSAFTGLKTMVGTSGGGFALMTEAVSLSAQSEVPVVFMMAQRAGPATGLPTYTMQGDLFFVLNAGHGEFRKIVASPGDASEAYRVSAELFNLSWKCQISGFLLIDKELAESTYTFDVSGVDDVKAEPPLMWDGKGDYGRYRITESGVSPLAFPGTKGISVRGTGYEHDENGITTEDSAKTEAMISKRLRKREPLIVELKKILTVNVLGNPDSDTAVVTWGFTKGACLEVCNELNLKLIQPIYLEPFPLWEMEKALSGVKKIICVELNATGQLARLLKFNGIEVDRKILKFDARPFGFEELNEKLKEVLKWK